MVNLVGARKMTKLVAEKTEYLYFEKSPEGDAGYCCRMSWTLSLAGGRSGIGWHMFGWNTFGVFLMGPAVATWRFSIH